MKYGEITKEHVKQVIRSKNTGLALDFDLLSLDI
jgi:hypothetical protein